MVDPRSGALPVLIIDGTRFSDFAGFCSEFSTLLDDYTWTGNLDAFNDILRGGFGTPEGGFVLRWLHSEQSRNSLGEDATIEYLEQLVVTCHPNHRHAMRERLDRTRRGQSSTLFDELVSIIRSHGPGGDEAEDGVHLDLL